MSDVLCLGEPLIEFNQQADGRFLQGFGGDVSNVAIAAARQGAKAAMATRLGADNFGDAIMALWAREGVDASAVARDPDAPTGIYFVLHGPEGHRFEYRRAGSAASLMGPDELPLEAIRAARLLHLSGISQAIGDKAADACFAAIAEARAAGVTVAYDTNLRLKLWPLARARAVIHAAVAGVDIVLPGLDDARALTGREDPEAIVRFYLDLGPSVVALTLGEAGAVVADRERVLRLPPRPARLVDASGAGDCFDGAFLAKWLATGDIEAAGLYANTAASLAVEGYGAVDPIPRASEVEAALAGQG